MRWTDEPIYAIPDAGLLRAAERAIARTDPARLRRLVESLPGPRNRLHAPAAMAGADELILAGWQDAGWRVERQELQLANVRARLDYTLGGERRYRSVTYRRLDGANLIAVLPGEERDAVVLVAHHDTVRDSPGADDNGAAVALLVELAAMLRAHHFRRTVVLAAPDFEEIGLVGSRHLVRWLRTRFRVRAVIVFDPVGFMARQPGSQVVPPGISRLYPGQVARLRARRGAGDTVVTLYRRQSEPLACAWATCLAAAIGEDRVIMLRDPVDLPVIGPLALVAPITRNFWRSDHVSFWRAGLPAIHVTNTANLRNPAYHGPGDAPDTLDYQTLAGIAAAASLLVEHLGKWGS
jgi:hypothetical protein